MRDIRPHLPPGQTRKSAERAMKRARAAEEEIAHHAFAKAHRFHKMPNDSMEPLLRKGDVLYCNIEANLEPGNIVLAFCDGEIVVGKLREFCNEGGELMRELIPLNSAWPSHRFLAHGGCNVEVVGKIVEFSRAVIGPMWDVGSGSTHTSEAANRCGG